MMYPTIVLSLRSLAMLNPSIDGRSAVGRDSRVRDEANV